MKIYIASYFDTRKRLYPIKHQLEKLGFEVISSWLHESKDVAYSSATEGYLLSCAIRDMADIRESSLFILDTLDVTPRGGREVELGLAIAGGKYIILVGPLRNVFHRLAHQRFETWKDCLEFLKKEQIAL